MRTVSLSGLKLLSQAKAFKPGSRLAGNFLPTVEERCRLSTPFLPVDAHGDSLSNVQMSSGKVALTEKAEKIKYGTTLL